MGQNDLMATLLKYFILLLLKLTDNHVSGRSMVVMSDLMNSVFDLLSLCLFPKMM